MEKKEKYKTLLRARSNTREALSSLSEIVCNGVIEDRVNEIKQMKIIDWVAIMNKDISYKDFGASMELLNTINNTLSNLTK